VHHRLTHPGGNTMALVPLILLAPHFPNLGLGSLGAFVDVAKGVCVLCW
jgi:hypothetical protein